MPARLMQGDSLTMLRLLPDASARCCVTSPPYWGLRDYGVACQRGLEATPALYVAGMVEVFREVRRVLTDDGTLWLNLGDSYTGSGKGGNPDPGSSKQATNAGSQTIGTLYGKTGESARQAAVTNVSRRLRAEHGMKAKDLVGTPWRVAFALQADGWYLRSDIIWHKPNPMPESVRDRPTKAHEYLFLLSKRERYYYDAGAIREPHTSGENTPEGIAARLSIGDPNGKRGDTKSTNDGRDRTKPPSRPPGYIGHIDGRNARSVWTIATQPYAEAHFATFPEELARRCILAGSAPGDTVLDPFGGSGTVAQVATGNGRNAIHIDINPEYCAMARRRIGPLLCESEDDFTASPKGGR